MNTNIKTINGKRRKSEPDTKPKRKRMASASAKKRHCHHASQEQTTKHPAKSYSTTPDTKLNLNSVCEQTSYTTEQTGSYRDGGQRPNS